MSSSVLLSVMDVHLNGVADTSRRTRLCGMLQGCRKVTCQHLTLTHQLNLQEVWKGEGGAKRLERRRKNTFNEKKKKGTFAHACVKAPVSAAYLALQPQTNQNPAIGGQTLPPLPPHVCIPSTQSTGGKKQSAKTSPRQTKWKSVSLQCPERDESRGGEKKNK